MAESGDITALVGDLNERLGAKLGLKRGSLSRRMKKAGRQLPRRVRRDAEVIDRAMELDAHPKLRRRIDRQSVDAAHKRIAGHLDGIDPKERRTRFILGLLSGVAFNILLMTALIIAVLKWRGLV